MYGRTSGISGLSSTPKPGLSGTRMRPFTGHRLAEQLRGEHRHDLVGARAHHQELGERAVVPGDHEMVAVDRRAVRHDQHAPCASARAAILISSVMPPHQPTSGWMMSQHSISSSMRKPQRVASCSPVVTSMPGGTARLSSA